MKNAFTCFQILVLTMTPVCWAEDHIAVKGDVSLGYCLRIDNEKRSYLDAALLNLLCAKGLPGAENIDIEKCLSTLKQWALLAQLETERLFLRFQKNPQEYNYSEGYFRTVVLVTVLSLDLGIRYNPDLIRKPSEEDLKSTAFFRKPQNLFIHGLITERLGTCSSIPVLTASVGRLLGYPMRLVNAKAHLYIRWEDAKERFNIESGGHGLKCHPDEYYMKWPFEISEEELKTGFYLKSLSPAEEFATFLAMRGLCLLENARIDEAVIAFRHAYTLYPSHPYLKAYIDFYKRQLDRRY